MDVRKISNAAEARALVESTGARHIKVGVFDMDGVLRGKYMHKDKFLSALEGGFGFCDVVLGWDSNDELYDNTRFTGWHTAYPDAGVRLLPNTCRMLPHEDNTLLFLGEFVGKAESICPRGTLRRTLKAVSDMGYKTTAALEFEFFLFEETPHSVREKGYRNLKPITPGNFGYSVIRNSVWSELYQELLQFSEDMDFPIEGLHTETGPGVIEAALVYDEALAAADKAALFKTFIKVFAQRKGLMATFMAKWSPDYPGQSGHIHISLQDKDNKSVFFDKGAPFRMSRLMRAFVAGQQHYMPEMLGMVANTVNSYSRLVPGAWAPTSATWGVENRTTALRVIPGSAKSQRVEYRIAAADCNPYLALAASIGSGALGIQEGLNLSPPVKGNAYAQEFPDSTRLPSTLWEAAQMLKASKAARGLFGDAFVEHYAASREWEERQHRKAVTDWELQRYFEII